MTFKYISIIADGNCLFHAISMGLANNYKHSKILRHYAVQHIKNNLNIYKPFIDINPNHYLHNMSQTYTYGDELCLKAISQEFDLQINIYDKYTSQLISTYQPKILKKIINLYFDRICLHYDYIVEL